MTQAAINDSTEIIVSDNDDNNANCISEPEHIIVVGAGPIGVRFCNDLLSKKSRAKVTLIGNEPYQPYNRVQLTGVLAGSIERDTIGLNLPSLQQHPEFSYVIANITGIDRENCCVTDTLGNNYHYTKLVLAVGSRPFVPSLPNIDLTGVYTFRNLKDTDSLYARLASVREIVVVGGGLLGIEAARALHRQNTQVTLVHHSDRLMNQQLDTVAAGKLRSLVESYGIEVMLNSRITKIVGDTRVNSIVIQSSVAINNSVDTYETERACNTILFSTGVKPNTQLALEAKLAFGKGIKVDEHLQTSEPNIYAIGECAEYNGETWGLVDPGYDQAAILADRLGGGESEYFGSTSLARLKILDQPICSIGDIESLPNEPNRSELVYQSKEDDSYCKIVFKGSKIIGTLGYGKWDELPRIQEALANNRTISPLRKLWFKFTGQLWPNNSESDITQWPATAIVCQCNGVTVNQILNQVDAGAATLSELKAKTSAGTGCGSCEYLLSSAVINNEPRTREKFTLPAIAISVIALIAVALQFGTSGLTPSNSVQTIGWFEQVWNDKFYKQVTGFTILGIITIAITLSMRKRIKKVTFGDYKLWRLLHAFLGVVSVGLVIVHTGMHIGDNLNRYLLFNFLAVIALGAFTSIVIGFSHRLSLGSGKRLREFWYWGHLFVTWPLPVLIALHIVSVYYF